jgi:predicted GNAT family acetyltransferase
MNVEHDPQHHRFFVEVAGGTAELTYAVVDAHTLDLLHTGVPEAAAEQGVGGKLAEAAFDWAHAHDTRLIPSCPFIRKWLERHPERKEQLALSNIL